MAAILNMKLGRVGSSLFGLLDRRVCHVMFMMRENAAFQTVCSAAVVMEQQRMTSNFSGGRANIGLGQARKVLNKNKQKWKPRTKRRIPHRSEMIDPDAVDWASVHPAAESYNPSVIPLPVRMGRPRHNRLGDIPPDARGNIELLKIPNFFHLTPVAIQKHCTALKEYCTPWPKEVGKLPIRITTINHIYSGPSVRHPDSRKVKLQIYLTDLELDEHAKKKLIRLSGHRYNPNNEELTIIADKCPSRKQNKEHAYYLLTALYHEAWKKEDWEDVSEDVPEEQLESEIEEVRSELYPQITQKKKIRRRFYRVVGDTVIRYNHIGHPFVYEMRKYGIVGGLKREHLDEAKQIWKNIQPELEDDSTFDHFMFSKKGSQN